jgi:thiamine-phosphate pyrophosphorylase
MQEPLSPSARRALETALDRARAAGAARVEAAHLLMAIAEQEESRAAIFLAERGLPLDRLRGLLETVAPATAPAPDPTAEHEPPRLSETVTASLVRARAIARGRDVPAMTDALLGELLRSAPELQSLLAGCGVDAAVLLSELDAEARSETEPLPAEFDRLELSDGVAALDTYRILDASANRAREGLRVLEDYARFVAADALLSAELKEMRHGLKQALDGLPGVPLLEARDTLGDVGTTVSTESEWLRPGLADVVAANFKRVGEALRSLEEFGKVEHRAMAEAIERLRYRLYTLERAALLGIARRATLDGVTLCVLVGSDTAAGGLEWTVREALEGGADLIQLREKHGTDRQLLETARRLRHWTGRAGAIFIVNDRPDLARLAGADGVHVGQDDLSVRDARRILGPRGLVGVSTHSIEQARRAELDGASYIGVGPVFPSPTKRFDEHPGRELVRRVGAEICLPAFAIGGITLDRLDEVRAAGASRVAVASAVAAASDPRAAAAAFRRRLDTPPA